MISKKIVADGHPALAGLRPVSIRDSQPGPVAGQAAGLHVFPVATEIEDVLCYPAQIRGHNGTFIHNIVIPRGWSHSYPAGETLAAINRWLIGGHFLAANVNSVYPQAPDNMQHFYYGLHLSRILVEKLGLGRIDLHDPDIQQKLVLYTVAHDLGRVYDCSSIHAGNPLSSVNKARIPWHPEVGYLVLGYLDRAAGGDTYLKAMMQSARTHGSGLGYHRVVNEHLGIGSHDSFLTDYLEMRDASLIDRQLVLLVAMADALNNTKETPDPSAQGMPFTMHNGYLTEVCQRIASGENAELTANPLLQYFVRALTDADDDQRSYSFCMNGIHFDRLTIGWKSKQAFPLHQLTMLSTEKLLEVLYENTVTRSIGFLDIFKLTGDDREAVEQEIKARFARSMEIFLE